MMMSTMDFGICTTPFMPLRAEPADTAPMVSSLLFGETFQILEVRGPWQYIKMTFDHYEGWLFSRQIEQFGSDSLLPESQNNQFLTGQPFQAVFNEQAFVHLGLGTPLPFFDGKYCFLKTAFFQVKGEVTEATYERESALQVAEQFMGTPYLWGGRSSFGIDCSGFTQAVMRYGAIEIPRDACYQVEQGQAVPTLAEARKGDLAFFKNEKHAIVHSGILADVKHIIHASETVRKDVIDEQGIFNEQLNTYTHTLAAIRRFF